MAQHDSSSWNLDTLFVHGGRPNQPTSAQGTPTTLPISTSTTYLHRDAESLDMAFEPEGEAVFVYARQGNANAYALEGTLARVEGGVGAVVFGSGMAATHAALMAAGLTPGVKILAGQDLYGATITMLKNVFVPLGVEVVLRDLCSAQAAEYIQAEQPDIIFVETLSNPLVKMVDLEAISRAAKEVGAVTIIDSTFTTPYLIRPIEHGFDLVVHSATKYMGGHGDSTAGVAISASKALLNQLRTYATTLGAMLSPFESHLIMRGLKTLPLRMERHCCNALKVAQFLQEHPSVSRVYYPGLPAYEQAELARRQLRPGFYGGLLSFDLKEPTREAAFSFINKLRLCMPVTTLGDIYSEISYPAISSHRGLSRADRQKMGISEGCIRLSVGIEDVADIIADLDQALNQ